MLFNTLSALVFLRRGDRTTKEVAEHFSCSEVTVKRLIAKGRRMGAEIVVTNDQEHGYRYHLANAEEIGKILNDWIAILQSASEIEKLATKENVLKLPDTLLF